MLNAPWLYQVVDIPPTPGAGATAADAPDTVENPPNARDGIVIDTKSKDFGPGDKVDAYDEHLIQLAAYRAGLDLPKARCANVFVSRSHPGLVRIVECTQDDLKRGWEMFAHLLALWKLKNDFKPWSLKI